MSIGGYEHSYPKKWTLEWFKEILMIMGLVMVFYAIVAGPTLLTYYIEAAPWIQTITQLWLFFAIILSAVQILRLVS